MKHVVVITGAPGTGKTTVRNYLTQKYAMSKILTHTTRPKRQGEIDGVDYYFETNESFDQNHFLEHVEYDDKNMVLQLKDYNERGKKMTGLRSYWIRRVRFHTYNKSRLKL